MTTLLQEYGFKNIQKFSFIQRLLWCWNILRTGMLIAPKYKVDKNTIIMLNTLAESSREAFNHAQFYLNNVDNGMYDKSSSIVDYMDPVMPQFENVGSINVDVPTTLYSNGETPEFPPELKKVIDEQVTVPERRAAEQFVAAAVKFADAQSKAGAN